MSIARREYFAMRTTILILLLVALLLAGTLACAWGTTAGHSFSNNAEVEAHSIFVATRAAAEGAPLVVATEGP